MTRKSNPRLPSAATTRIELEIRQFLVRLEGERFGHCEHPLSRFHHWSEAAGDLLKKMGPFAFQPGYDPKSGFEAQDAP